MPGKRKVPQAPYLGLGSHEFPDSGDSVRTGRTVFLREVAAHVPDVLVTLREDPYEGFRAHMAKTFGTIDPHDPRVERWILFHFHMGDVAELEATMAPWASRWHLDVPWVRSRAVGTMYEWWELEAAGLEQGGPLEWGWRTEGSMYEKPVGGEDLVFDPALPIWEPWRHTRGEARAALEFEEQLSSYLDRVEDLCLARGVRRKPEKRTKEHFEWLAKYQCGGMEQIDLIALLPKSEHGRAEPAKTIKKGLAATSVLIGLPLRAGRRGRPRDKGELGGTPA